MKKLMKKLLSVLLLTMLIGCRTINIPPRGAERRCHFVSIRPINATSFETFAYLSRTYHSISLSDAKRLYKNEFPHAVESELEIHFKRYDYEWDWDKDE